MSQVILYLICELSRKLKQLMLGNECVSKRKDIKSIVAGHEATDAATAYPSTNKREAFGRSRLPTLVNVNGFGQCIAVLTSGGDAQGMNAAIRAVVRMGLYAGARVFTVWEVCKIVIGGDGSLTGANLFRQEWQGLLEELVESGAISKEVAANNNALNIVGMVGSIDNDFCGTDMTIGADSALHRIFEAVDAIVTTASSHQRTFVLEVMGRHCGYLALVSGLGVGADYVFIPEWPVKEGWEDRMCNHLKKVRDSGRRLCIVIVAEGAKDDSGNPVTANQVKELIKCRLQHDTRVTILGHVQRGGAPSAFDRILSCRMGAEAALAVLDAKADTAPCVICLDGNKIAKRPLMECVEKTLAVKEATKKRDFEKVVQLRGRYDIKQLLTPTFNFWSKVTRKKRHTSFYGDFQLFNATITLAVKEATKKRDFEKVVQLRGRTFKSNIEIFKVLRKVEPPASSECDLSGECKSGYTLAVINIGAPAGGMSTAVRAFVRSALYQGHSVLGIRDGIDGLLQDKVELLGWLHVDSWVGSGGSKLGTTRTLPSENFQNVADQFTKYDIQGLLIVGGFEAYHSLLQLAEAREEFEAFRIPMLIIPATISNNVPGTDLSLGADTALNVITEMCDRIKQSASSATRRVFVVECMGGYCGYLATMSALAGGADATYVFEDKLTLEYLKINIEHLINKMRGSVRRGLVIRCICIAGVVRTSSPDTACLLGIKKAANPFTPVQELKLVTDFKHRLATKQWWTELRTLQKILARYHEQLEYRREDQTP
ncbi:PREDICTED: ATP-dependent 6-phosphofructokinase, muscle type-like [Acropora digitifera]|uniref:ATP-dependent 6-phosphofructokinase, muscle type-like n=1 Tax=Acropora digitifera TaxID=70779 RepID=UPI00077A2D52|nr:PREDICTED: ATP-dependent 6-phosphofructokinase, muscle type-like [Acropora digitifera]